MTVHYRPCFQQAGTSNRVWLPTPIYEWNDRSAYDLQTFDVPEVDGRRLGSFKRGPVRITIRGLLRGYGQDVDGYYQKSLGTTLANLQLIEDELREELHDYAPFDLYRWHNRHWEQCYPLDLQIGETHRTGHVHGVEYALTVEALDPTCYSTNPLELPEGDGGAWEMMTGNSAPLGSGGGPPILLTSQTYSDPLHVSGMVQVTANGEDWKIIPRAAPNRTISVVEIAVKNCEPFPGASGNTIVRVGTSSLGATGSTNSLTLPAASRQHNASFDPGVSPPTGSISVETDADGIGAPFYVFFPSAAQHSDLDISIVLQASDE